MPRRKQENEPGLCSDEIEVPFRRPRGRPPGGKLKRTAERKSMLNDVAAMAYVAMENGDYGYGRNEHPVYDKEGNHAPNKTVVMRLGGYSMQPSGSPSVPFDEGLGNDPEFWDFVNLHRLRRTDPMFRKESRSRILEEIAGLSAELLYERLKYMPHSVSTAEVTRVLDSVIKTGVLMRRLEAEEHGKVGELLDMLTPEQRTKALDGRKELLRKELEGLERLEGAHRAADRETSG